MNAVTSALLAAASFTAMWPRPPSPTTPTRWPAESSQCCIGENVVMPAQRSGAVAARSMPGGMRMTKCSATTIAVE